MQDSDVGEQLVNAVAISAEVVTGMLDSVRARLSELGHARSDIDRQIAKAQEQERLLQRLLALQEGQNADVQDFAPETPHSTPERRPAEPEHRHPLVQAVLDELALAGRPLHISDLMRLLQERKVRIPGAGTQANVIAHLRRDSRLVRPSRGMYGLSTWGLGSAMPKPLSKRKKRIRVRAGKQKE